MPLTSPEAPRDPALFREVRSLLLRGRNHLRRRHLLRGAVLGAGLGTLGALAVAILSRFWWRVPHVEPWWVVGGVPVLAGALGALVGAARAGLAPREVALLLDRALGTGELLVTALYLEKAPPSWSRAVVEARLAQRLAERPRLAEALPVRLPRRDWGIPLLVAAALLVVFLVPQRPGAGMAAPDSPTVAEAARLQERLDKLDSDYDVALPEDLEQKVDDLVARLRDGSLDPEQARQQIEALQGQVRQLQDDLAQSQAAADDLDAAARELADDPHTSDLGDALHRKDLAGAGAAAQDLAQQVAQMSPEERQQAGKALQQAGRRLQGSSQSGLQQTGQAMQSAGQQLQQAGQQGRSGPQGPSGPQGQAGTQGQPSRGGQSGGDRGQASTQQLAEALKRQQRLGQQLQSDSQKLAKSQEINGALEGSDQRLGGQGDVARGQAGSKGQQPGKGSTSGAQLAQAPDYGVGHTWEDQGTQPGTGPTEHHDADRQSSARGGQELDDFQQLYAPVRDPNTGTLVTGVHAKVDDKGHIDVLPTRRTGGTEDARAPLLQVPATYKQAADQALSGEKVPAGYREAVKQYFDSME